MADTERPTALTLAQRQRAEALSTARLTLDNSRSLAYTYTFEQLLTLALLIENGRSAPDIDRATFDHLAKQWAERQ